MTSWLRFPLLHSVNVWLQGILKFAQLGISGLVAEYIVAIDVTWVRFPADAVAQWHRDEVGVTCIGGPVVKHRVAIRDFLGSIPPAALRECVGFRSFSKLLNVASCSIPG